MHWVLELELQQTNNDYENVITIIITVAYNKCSALAEMGDRLATIDMGRKVGVLCPFFRRSWIPI